MDTVLIDQTLTELKARGIRSRHIMAKIENKLQHASAHQAGQHGRGSLDPPEVARELTGRERQVLGLICEEYSGKQIAAMLDLSAKTVASHRVAITAKLGALNTAGIVRIAIRRGLIEA
jgi:DNA-binding CsgD family transcriptional regulator